MPFSKDADLAEASSRHREPRLKPALRRLYGLALGSHVFLTARRRAGQPRVYYAGARAGDVGGPLVKVKRLMAYFPQRLWNYNLVYALSNAAYLPASAVRTLSRRGVAIVHNQDGVFYHAWYGGDWRAANAAMSVTYHAANHVFWQSEFCRRAADRFLGPRRGGGEVLYNAVDTERFRPARAAGARRGTLRLLMTGKFDRHIFYRLESTIRAVALARRRGLEASLACAGWVQPEALAAAERLAAELGISGAVAFTGAYSQEEAPAVYRAADVYITTKHMDPCPNAVLEAMATGLPVIYSASGGVRELVGAGGIGLDAPENWDRIITPSEDAIATALEAVAGRAAELGRVARERAVTKFDLKRWIERHRAVFSRVLEATA